MRDKFINAFPYELINSDGTRQTIPGMTLLEYAAIEAMKAYIPLMAGHPQYTIDNIIEDSINTAERLLAKLEPQ